MKVEFTDHEIEMLDFYWTLPEAHQLYIRETMKVILANIQEEKQPMVRQVLISMFHSDEEAVEYDREVEELKKELEKEAG